MTNKTQHHKTGHSSLARMSALVLGITIGIAASAQAFAGNLGHDAQWNTVDAFWIWDIGDPADLVGESTIVRTENGVSVRIDSLFLPPRQAVTMLILVFNNPEFCATAPCSAVDLFNPEVQGDFFVGSGQIVGGSGRGTFAGHVSLGDTSGSGHLEIGYPQLAVGLLDSYDAEIHVSLHSHGPAQYGPILRSQIRTYLGGCEFPLLGNAFGVAQGPADVPDSIGECSTIQAAVHLP